MAGLLVPRAPRAAIRSLALLALLCAGLLSPSQPSAEPAFRAYYFSNNADFPILGASKEEVCTSVFPVLFHPELNWKNPRFSRWVDQGVLFGEATFACIGDNDIWQNDERAVGFGWCDTATSGDAQSRWFVDTTRERCICNPASFVTENGLCITPPNSKCQFVVDGVCHGGKNNGAPCPPCGNPINPANGNKFHSEALYRGGHGLALDVSYNVQDDEPVRFGRRWRDSYDRRIVLAAGMAIAYRGDGKGLRFLDSGGAWMADADTADRLTELKNANGTRTGWRLEVAEGDELEAYDAAGKLLSIALRTGLTHRLAYTDGTAGPGGGLVLGSDGAPTAIALPAGLLIRVEDPFGRALVFGYGADMRVSRVTDPDGGAYRFAYDGQHRLVSVRFPDGRLRVYHYNEAAHTGGIPQSLALTGITDENGQRHATYKYDAQGRAVSTENGQGVNRYTLVYNADGSSSVTDPLATTRIYGFHNALGALKNAGISGPACPSCGPASQSFDANGNVSSRLDWNGNRTDFVYDLARNLETSRTEGLTAAGAATAQTRTITTAWHAAFRLPAQIAQPLRITTNIYDADGSQCGARGALCSRSVQATSDTNGSQGFGAAPLGEPRTWRYTYDGNGSVLTIDGPRIDVRDVTTYAYYPNDDPDPGKRGNVATITNAAGHTTTITAYNAHGQPVGLVDANGLATTLAYDARQRLTSRKVGGEITSYDYDGVGQLTKATLPDGSFVSYSYDAAHRMTGMQDNLGNRIAYSLDAMGNRVQEQVFDPSSNLAQTRSRIYDGLNRLFRELGAHGQITEYAYDDQGNVVSVKDPLERITSSQYDALNRLKQVTDPALGVTQYAYDGLDALTQVTDPRSLVTGYTVDGLGNLTQQQSPDTGTTVNTYDAAGNLLTQTDAKGQTTAYAYDALGRVILIAFQDGARQAYAYDHGANGIGRLSSITETDRSEQVTSRIVYGYDEHGRVTSETRTVAGVQFVTGYRYDGAGRLDRLIYPSGRVVSYAFDELGRIASITTAKDGDPQVVVQDVAYHPFGGAKSYTLGNGQTYARSIDLDGRIASYTLGSQIFGIGYDAASRIEFIAELGNPSNANTYGYDSLDRLTQALVPGNSYAYTYDAVGNRTSRSAGSSTEIYAYSPTSNRIASITSSSGAIRSFVFDANGSTTADGNNAYTYDARGRMVQAVSSLGATSYQLNALGQRTRKTNSVDDRVFHYDTRGRLIAESSPEGVVRRELIYLGDIPVGVVQ